MTRCASHTRRIATIVSSSSGSERSTPEISAPSAPATGWTSSAPLIMRRSGGCERGNEWAALGRLEDEPDPLADPDLIEITVDEVRHHRHALIEGDVRDGVRNFRAAHDA